VLQDYIHAVEEAESRRDRLTREIGELMPSWSMAPVAASLQAMRGVAAVTVVAEVGAFRHFTDACQLMHLGQADILRRSRRSVRPSEGFRFCHDLPFLSHGLPGLPISSTCRVLSDIVRTRIFLDGLPIR
jgi:hypothetical protein